MAQADDGIVYNYFQNMGKTRTRRSANYFWFDLLRAASLTLLDNIGLKTARNVARRPAEWLSREI